MALFLLEASCHQRPDGRPLGEIQPMYQATRMIKNSPTEIATRIANARAMRLSGASAFLSAPGRRNMNTPALPNAARMPITANTMITFMAMKCRIP